MFAAGLNANNTTTRKGAKGEGVCDQDCNAEVHILFSVHRVFTMIAFAYLAGERGFLFV